MKTTSPVLLLVVGVLSTIAGAAYGILQVSHGHPLPVAHPTSLLTMPIIAVLLFLIALPVIRYRRALLEQAKTTDGVTTNRPKRLDPFYAVRVLILAKSTSVASSVLGGFQLGLLLLQLTTPVVASNLWLNLLGVLGAVLALVVALIVERNCKIPGGGVEPEGKASTSTDGAAA